MPRKSQGARLYLHPKRRLFYIRDGSRFIGTGTSDRRQAEGALARYLLSDKGRPTGPASPDQMTVADALDLYGTERAPHTKDPERIGYAIAALLPILGILPVTSVTGAVCRRYGKARGVAPGTVRKELQTLQAAINHCVREGYLTSGRQLTLPPQPPARDRWLTRDEVASLLRAARRDPMTRHVARFILIAVYSGSRSSAILNLRFGPHVGGGWIDTERGVMYRRASGEAETKKRQPPAPIPPRLLAHLRRWERMGAAWAVEYRGAGTGASRGGRVASLKKAWATVLKASGIDHCVKHDLRHTCATWLMQAGADKWAAAGYLGMTVQTLERVYGHHHPDYMKGAVAAFVRMRNTG